MTAAIDPLASPDPVPAATPDAVEPARDSAGVDSSRMPAASPPPFREAVRGDLARIAALKRVRFPSVLGLVDIAMLPGTWAVLTWRVSVALHRRGLRPLSRLLYFLNMVLFSVDLAPTAIVGPGLALPHPIGCGFGDVRVGRNFVMMGGARLGAGAIGDLSRDGFPTVGDDCLLLDGAKIFGPVTIGHDSVVSVNSVVLRDLPSGIVAMGHPARVIRHRFRSNKESD